MKIIEPLFIEVAKQLIHHEYETSSSRNNHSFFSTIHITRKRY
jgi:hypothetical protein